MPSIRKIEQLIPSLPSRKRVAAYARVSGERDASLHSLSAQISHYSAFIQRHKGWEYAGVYADEAMTGTKDSRAEFQRLLRDCRDGRIDIILTKSISRFARNTVDLLETVRELREMNVEVYFERENIRSMSGDGELMLTILASFAQEESRSVSENCKWRIRKRFAKGEIVNLRFMFGYRVVKGQIEIDPEKADIVRMIFEDYISGMGGDRIAKKLRNMGVSAIRGGTWCSKRVIEIIKNEKYTGNALLQKKFVTDHLTKKEVWNKGQLKQYYAEGTHLAIIATETYEKANEIMEQRRLAFRVDREEQKRYPFTGIIRCGLCDKKYQRRASKGRYFWICSTFQKEGKSSCPSKQIPEPTLIQITVEVLGLDEFDEAIFAEEIIEIRVPGANMLTFVFADGRVVEKTWHDRSRSESWTDEMREAARQKAKERSREIWEKQEQ